MICMQLSSHCDQFTDIFPQTLTFKLMPKIDDVLKADVVKWSAFYEHRIRNGSVRISASSYVLTDTNSFTEGHLPP
jgi:replication factor C subunit 3/5